MKRTLITAIGTLIAAGVPLAAWYLAGTRDLEHEAVRLEGEARAPFETRAAAIAKTISQRLEVLRRIESRRTVDAWPAAPGGEPLIGRYFDVHGAAADPFTALLDVQVRALRKAMPPEAKPRPVRVVERVTVEPEAASQPQPHSDDVAALTVRDASTPKPEPVVVRPVTRLFDERQQQAVPLNLNSNVATMAEPLKAVLVDPRPLQPDPQPWPEPHPDAKPQAAIARRQLPLRPEPIMLGELVWRSLPLDGIASLVAVRPLVTRGDVRVQGFVVSPDAMSALVQPFAGAQLRNGARHAPSEAAANVTGIGSWVVIDESNAIAAAKRKAAQDAAAFQRIFLIVAAAALLACVAVVAMVANAERFARERSRFAAAAAHELRTPLASLRLHADMIADNLGDPSQTKQYAQRLSAEAERLGRVVANVLDFTRLEKGSLAVAPKPDDLGDAVAECVTSLQPVIASAGCKLQLSVEPSLPQVAVDREALFHIAQNLLDNAEKYSRASSDRTIDVSVARCDGGVALAVGDRGPGLPRHTEFVPFRRGSNGKGAPAGLGLGLSLVAALTRAQGASMAWQPRDGGGTVFRVVFPSA